MLKSLLNELSSERMMEHVRFLAEQAPMRLAGSAMEKRAADYFKSQFDDAGVAMTLHEIDGFVSFPRFAQIEVLGPERRVIEAMAFAQAKSTPPGGLEADLLYAGAGGVGDYEGVDARGKITLSELSYSPPRPEKVRLATVNGSVGQIMMNWGQPEHDTMPMGTCKAVWGNPTPENFATMPEIPAIGVKLKDGQYLAALAKRGPVRICMTCDVERRWGKMLQPIGVIKGATDPDKFVLIAGHYDAWGPGATDNATGNAGIIEIARVLGRHRDKLRRSVVFAFWAAHESGIMEGSSWYIDHHWDDLTKNCVLALNVDSCGMIGANEFTTACSPELRKFNERLIREVLAIDPPAPRRLDRNGDQSFFGAGVPSMISAFEHSAEQKKEWRGATLGWWYHSEYDTPDKVDPALLSDSIRMSAAYIFELASAEILPYTFSETARLIRERAAALARYDVEIDLRAVAQRAEQLERRLERFDSELGTARKDGRAPAAAARNAAAIRLSRILTPLLMTIGGRWSQDSYGLTALNSDLPGLARIPAMAEAGRDSAFYKLAWSEVARQRNRIMDGLKDAGVLLDDYFAAALDNAPAASNAVRSAA